MSALTLHPEQPIDRTDWVPIEDAAIALGKSVSVLTKRCRRLQGEGLAKKVDIGRTQKWHISAAYDARLIRRGLELVDGKSTVLELMKTTTAAKRSKAQTDAAIVIAFRKWRTGDGGSFDAFRAKMIEKHGRCPGRSRVYDMDAQCPTSADITGCVAALIDGRGRPSGESASCSDEAWDFFCGLYLTTNQWSLSKAHRHTKAMADVEDWSWPSVSRVRQLVKQRITPSTLTLKRIGPGEWKRQHQAPIWQDKDAQIVGETWVGDHTPHDFFCRIPRGDRWVAIRPDLTMWIDWRTRLVVGYSINEQSNSHAIREALIKGLRTDGISAPAKVWMDNGKDFMAASIGGMTKKQRRKMTKAEQTEYERSATGLLGMLGIEPHFALPYNSDGKSRVERFFRTMHQDFDKEFPSYIGNSPTMMDAKIRRENFKDVMALPTIDEVRDRFDAWVSAYNCRSEHRMDDLCDAETRERMSPIEFYERHLPTMRAVERDALRLLEPVWSRPLKVHKYGISITIGGGVVRYGEMNPKLEPLVGSDRRVFVSYDIEDTSKVTVWDEHFEMICVAMENGRSGGLATDKITLADRKEATRRAFSARRDQRNRAKKTAEDFTTLTLDKAELASKITRDREVAETKARLAEYHRERDPNDQPNLRLVRTNIKTDASDVESEQQRVAVGAEEFDPAEMGSLVDAVHAADRIQDSSDPFDGLSLDDCAFDDESDDLAYTGDLHAAAFASLDQQSDEHDDTLDCADYELIEDIDDHTEPLGFTLIEAAHDD